MDATSGPDSEARRKLTGLLEAGDLDAMLAACGGYGATLADLVVALRFIGRQRHPDLGAALRLGFARDELLRRNRRVPAELPAVWARLGEPDRAEAMARTLSDPPGVRGDVLLSLADIALAAGDSERGLRLADEIEEAAEYPARLCALATVLSRAGELERARRLVDEAEAQHGGGYPNEVIEAHIAVGQADRAEAIMSTRGRSTSAMVALAGVEDHPERRRELIDEALARLRTERDLWNLTAALGALAKAMIDIGEGHRLVGVVKDLASSEYDDVRVERLYTLGNVVAGVGDLGGARLLLAEARAVDETIPWDQKLIDQEAWGADPEPSEASYELRFRVGESPGCKPATRCATALVRVGDRERAEALVRLSYPGEWRAASLATLASRAAAVGDLDRARRLAAESEAASRTTRSLDDAKPELVALAKALAEAGDLEQAEAVAHSIREPGDRLAMLAMLASRAAAVGDLDRARRLVQEPLNKIRTVKIKDEWKVWIKSVQACTDLGDPALAEHAARFFTSGYQQSAVRTQLAEAWIRVGNLERAEATARPYYLYEPLALVARAWIEAGDLARAEAIALDELPNAPADLLIALAKARVATGDLDRAEVIARGAKRPAERARVLIALAATATRTGEVAGLIDAALDAARAVTPEIERVRTLTALIHPLGGLGERERIAQVATEAVEVVRAHPRSGGARDAEALLAEALAEAGELERAQDIAVSLVVPPAGGTTGEVLRMWTTVADGCAAIGDFNRAEDVVAASPAFHRPRVLAVLATTSWRAGDRERMNQLLDKAEAVAHALPDPGERRGALADVATAWVRVGDPERAEAIIRSVPGSRHLPFAWETLADALVAAGELARAGALAFTITIPKRRAILITSLAEAGDDPDRVRRLVAAALVDTPAELLLPVLAKVDPAAVIAAASGHGGDRRSWR